MNDKITVQKFSLSVVRDRETGRINSVNIELDGMLHSPTDDQPAWVLYDDQERPWKMYWMKENGPHRENGPALTRINPDTGVVEYEQYNQNGELHRPLPDPARISRDPQTGEVVQEIFALNGEIVDANGVPYPDEELDLGCEP